MNVASKLRGAFALYIALLAGVLVYHVGTIRRSVASGHELTAISDRYRVITDDQLGRIAEMGSSAEKYLVTRDRGYMDKFAELVAAFGGDIRRLDSLALSEEERATLVPLMERWRAVEIEVRSLGRDSSSALTVETLARLEQTLDDVAMETQQLGAAAQTAMTRELARSELGARDAERLAWAAAATALVLSVLLSALLVRSIVRPLERLAKGTREISAGRLDFRLDSYGRDELSQVAREFNAMTERLEELDQMKRDFVSNVSHDLKTPLSSMQETNEVLLDELPGPLSDKQRYLLQLSQESGRRLSAMIAKLLELSRLEAAQTATVDVVDLGQLVHRAMDRYDVARTGKSARVILREVDESLSVSADADALTQVLDNLVENALKFSPADGHVEVTVAAHGTEALLMVADEGPGIADADKERVFERFYQTEAGRSVRSRGTGLGLAICRHIVDAHGGRIWVSDNAPRGCVLNVSLPLVAIAAPSAATLEMADSAA
jgi:signal transduction histidine kinase